MSRHDAHLNFSAPNLHSYISLSDLSICLQRLTTALECACRFYVSDRLYPKSAEIALRSYLLLGNPDPFSSAKRIGYIPASRQLPLKANKPFAELWISWKSWNKTPLLAHTDATGLVVPKLLIADPIWIGIIGSIPTNAPTDANSKTVGKVSFNRAL
ncbi:hypothetical protein V2G26_001206 [Clonostachys chloroleuca]